MNHRYAKALMSPANLSSIFNYTISLPCEATGIPISDMICLSMHSVLLFVCAVLLSVHAVLLSVYVVLLSVYATSGSLGGLVVSKSHACYLLEGAVKTGFESRWDRNFSCSAGGVSGHA